MVTESLTKDFLFSSEGLRIKLHIENVLRWTDNSQMCPFSRVRLRSPYQHGKSELQILTIKPNKPLWSKYYNILLELEVVSQSLVKINQDAQLHPGEVLEQDLFNYSNKSNVSHYL